MWRRHGIEYVVWISKREWDITTDDFDLVASTYMSFRNPDDWTGDWRVCPARVMAESCWSGVVNALMDHEIVTPAFLGDYPATNAMPESYYGAFVVHDEGNEESIEVCVWRTWGWE